MKRGCWMMAALLVLLMLLPGCGAGTAEKLTAQTESYFDAVRAFDLDVINELLTAGQEETDPIDLTDEGNVMTEPLRSYCADCAAKMTYEVVSVDEENLTAEVRVRFVDGSGLLGPLMIGMLGRTLQNGLSGNGEMTEEDARALLDQALAGSGEETMTETVVTLTFRETENGYEVSETSPELFHVVTANLLGKLAAAGEETGNAG